MKFSLIVACDKQNGIEKIMLFHGNSRKIWNFKNMTRGKKTTKMFLLWEVIL